jgi:hypothetical protein
VGQGKGVKIVDIEKNSRYFEVMNENTANYDTERPAEQKPKTIAGYLASAMDMEDEISRHRPGRISGNTKAPDHPHRGYPKAQKNCPGIDKAVWQR